MEAAMARPRRRALQPSDIEGLEYFDTLVPLLARLKDIGTQRDRAGNRQLFYDQYVCSDSRKNLNTYKTKTYVYTISQRNHYLGTLQT